MPAPFASSLIGLRVAGGNPNTSDNNDDQSIELGLALMRAVGTPADQIGPERPGDRMVSLAIQEFQLLRPDLMVGPSKAVAFAQYAHLGVYPEFRRSWREPSLALAPIERAVDAIESTTEQAALRAALAMTRGHLADHASTVERLTDQMPEESLLALDVAVGEPSQEGPPLLALGLSAKWSLRTDRAQDCISQGSKLVALRRGRMPHYAVITMEPRPAMLKILADGSGAIDCVYHLDLPALKRAILDYAARKQRPDAWSPRVTFSRLLRQGRVRDYDDLLAELRRVPVGSPPSRATASAP